MNLAAIATAVALLNIVMLSINAWVMVNIKLYIEKLKAEIAENRRVDANELREYVDIRVQEAARRFDASR